MSKRAFTLTELLIVVAIIAILAAIAVPNLLEAQTRAKVSRTRADMRAVAAAIEAYRVDSNHYPPPFGVTAAARDSWAVLSTPIAYLASGRTVDPFSRPRGSVEQSTPTYELINGNGHIIEVPATAPWSVSPPGQTGTWWWIASRGPDLRYGFQNPAIDPETNIRQKFFESDLNHAGWLTVVYDPTNGTISLGNLYRAGGVIRGFAGLTMNR
jgi:prepilin-type N-terminal cleavage/methylation domain-containing protein